jgi:hypoxanthine phosphoribosyltransferase
VKRSVTLHDLTFQPLLTSEVIGIRIKEIGTAITSDHQGHSLLFIGILNGSFIFMADLIRAVDLPCEVAFVRIQSYAGTQSMEPVMVESGLPADMRDRHIILVEDIVDTGKTVHTFLPKVMQHSPASVSLVTLLYKRECLQYAVDIAHAAFEIKKEFVVGYGLDYDGLGRNLPDIYQLKEE